MYINWKPLLGLGVAFWGLLCCTDVLGESTWKRCSSHLEDILKGMQNEISKKYQEIKLAEGGNSQKQKMNWPVLLWNVCAFLCSLVFCSVIRSMSWVVWKLFKFYNVFRNRKAITDKLTSRKTSEEEVEDCPQITCDKNPNCKVLFKNQMFSKQDNGAFQEQISLTKELEEMRKEKSELSQQLVIAQKENLTARQQIEEYKLETYMMKEKLARTANSLKENLKYKDFANANQEMMVRKAHSLELHLKEISKDRDILRTKLSSLEKNYTKIEERLKMYEKQDSETNMEQFPEKDTSKPAEHEGIESEATIDVDISKFQKKIMSLRRSKLSFDGNSKISVDLDESSFDTSKENDSENLQDGSSDSKKADIDLVKQNILNYNAYKAQMMRPKIKLANIKERMFSQAAETTGSSSDENTNSSPHRIISSTVEFQNFLKTLTSNSASSVNFTRNFF